MDKWIEWLKTSVWGAMPELSQGAELVFWLAAFGLIVFGFLSLLKRQRDGIKLPKNLFVVVTLPWRWAIGLLCGAIGLFIVYFALTLIVKLWITLPEDGKDPSAIRYHATVLIGCLAAIGGIFTIFFTTIRAFINERQTKALEQSHITDQINKAVEGLGAEKIVKEAGGGNPIEYTRPNVEVRTGAMFTLERIAKHNPNEHLMIMEIIIAYIRNNSKKADLDFDGPRIEHPTKPEIQQAIQIIGRRTARQKDIEKNSRFRFDFRFLDLSGYQFSEGDFSGSRFNKSCLNDTHFIGSNLTGVNFSGSQLDGAVFIDATIDGTIFSACTMSETRGRGLVLAQIISVYLDGATMPNLRIHRELFKSNVTFGDRSTKISTGHEKKNSVLDLIEQVEFDGIDNGQIPDASKTIEESGFKYWSYFEHNDGANIEFRKKFAAKFDHKEWPYQ